MIWYDFIFVFRPALQGKHCKSLLLWPSCLECTKSKYTIILHFHFYFLLILLPPLSGIYWIYMIYYSKSQKFIEQFWWQSPFPYPTYCSLRGCSYTNSENLLIMHCSQNLKIFPSCTRMLKTMLKSGEEFQTFIKSMRKKLRRLDFLIICKCISASMVLVLWLTFWPDMKTSKFIFPIFCS